MGGVSSTPFPVLTPRLRSPGQEALGVPSALYPEGPTSTSLQAVGIQEVSLPPSLAGSELVRQVWSPSAGEERRSERQDPCQDHRWQRWVGIWPEQSFLRPCPPPPHAHPRQRGRRLPGSLLPPPTWRQVEALPLEAAPGNSSLQSLQTLLQMTSFISYYYGRGSLQRELRRFLMSPPL